MINLFIYVNYQFGMEIHTMTCFSHDVVHTLLTLVVQTITCFSCV